MRFIRFAKIIGAAFLAASLAGAQQAQPKPKSQKEVEALQKVQAAAQANNPDAEIQAINYVLENFVDTDYKPMLLSMGMQAANAKGDPAQLQVFGERAIEADPKYATAYAKLAIAYSRFYALHSDAGALELAQANAERAITIDQTSGDAHTALAYVFEAKGDQKNALVEIEREARRTFPAGRAESYLTLLGGVDRLTSTLAAEVGAEFAEVKI